MNDPKTNLTLTKFYLISVVLLNILQLGTEVHSEQTPKMEFIYLQ